MDTEIQPFRPSILQNSSERKPTTLPRRRCRHDARVLLPRIRYILIAIVFCVIIPLGRADDRVSWSEVKSKIQLFAEQMDREKEELFENLKTIIYLLVFLFSIVICDIMVRFSRYIHRKWTGKDPNDELYHRLEDLIKKNFH